MFLLVYADLGYFQTTEQIFTSFFSSLNFTWKMIKIEFSL